MSLEVVCLEIDGCCQLWVSSSTNHEVLAWAEVGKRGKRENETGEVKTINIHKYKLILIEGVDYNTREITKG